MEIYIHKNGGDLGPFSPERIKEGLTHGDFSRSDHAWREGLADWLPLGDVIQSTAPQAPPSSVSNASSPTGEGAAHIFVVRSQTVLGPFTVTEVNAQLKIGVLTAADVAKHSGSETLWPLLAVPGIVRSSLSSPAQIPAAGSVPAFGTQTFAGFWVRFVAYMVDVLVMYVPYLIIHSPLTGAISRVRGEDDVAGQLNVVLTSLTTSLVGICAWWLYSAFAESSAWQGTVGKKLLGLRVTNLAGGRISFGQATGRYFSKCVSAMILGIGFLMAGFTERKQALHDFMAGTFVIRFRPSASGGTLDEPDTAPAVRSEAIGGRNVFMGPALPSRAPAGHNSGDFATTRGEQLQNGGTRANLILAIVVVVGLLVLGTFLLLGPGRHGADSADQREKIAAARSMLTSFELALDQFEVDNGYYPKSGDLTALTEAPANASNWKGPYLKSVPLDPWGSPYTYEHPGKHNTSSYEIASNGPDGRSGTEDDVSNWTGALPTPRTAGTPSGQQVGNEPVPTPDTMPTPSTDDTPPATDDPDMEPPPPPKIAASRHRETAGLADTTGGNPAVIRSDSAELKSPLGDLIVLRHKGEKDNNGNADEIWLACTISQRPPKLLCNHDFRTGQISFSPDEQWIVVTDGGGPGSSSGTELRAFRRYTQNVYDEIPDAGIADAATRAALRSKGAPDTVELGHVYAEVKGWSADGQTLKLSVWGHGHGYPGDGSLATTKVEFRMAEVKAHYHHNDTAQNISAAPDAQGFYHTNATVFGVPADFPNRVTAAPVVTQTPAGGDYTLYTNSRNGYSVMVPAILSGALREDPSGNTVTATSADGRTKLLLRVKHGGGTLEALYKQWTAEHTAKDPGKLVDYKTLRNNWFAVSGLDGPRGYYVKVVVRGSDALFLCLEYDEKGGNVTQEMLTAMSRSFTGDMSASRPAPAAALTPSVKLEASGRDNKATTAAYNKLISDAIGKRWYYYVAQRADLIAREKVKIHFVIAETGHVSGVKIVSGNANGVLADISVAAITEAEIPPIPPDVADTLDGRQMEVDYDFSQY